MDLGNYQNAIPALPSLNTSRYERIFKMFKTDNNQYYYNLLQSIYMPNQIDTSKTFNLTVKQNMPWTMVSFNAYGNIELWWLIMLTNKMYNPVKGPELGQILTLIKPEYIPDVLDEISRNLA